MLTEFAFTPSIFDETIHLDPETWSGQLERLADRMFPHNHPSPVIIANLCSGGWSKEASRYVRRIRDANIRDKAMKLLTRMDVAFVERPFMAEWPVDQLAWCREAIECAKQEPIERIVACRFAMDGADTAPREVRCLTEVRDSGFWSAIPADDSHAMDIRVQMQALRKLCFHAGFICLVTPHVNGGTDDETDFAAALIRAAADRPADRAPAVVEIHTEAPRGAAAGDPTTENYARAIGAKIAHELGPGFHYTLTLWSIRLLHRYVIAGDMTEDADGRAVQKPRWAISANHFAKRSDASRGLLPADWKLLNRDRVRALARQFCVPANASVIYSKPLST